MVSARVRPLPASVTASTGAGSPASLRAVGWASRAVAPGLSRETRFIPSSGGRAAQRASLVLGSRLSEVTGWVRPEVVSWGGRRPG